MPSPQSGGITAARPSPTGCCPPSGRRPMRWSPRLRPRGRQVGQALPPAWHHDPSYRDDISAMLAEEERRLFYVAVTRARDQLYLSWAPVDPARVRPLDPSPFLAEVAVAGAAVDVAAVVGDLVSTLPATSLAAVAQGAAPAPAVPGAQLLVPAHLPALPLPVLPAVRAAGARPAEPRGRGGRAGVRGHREARRVSRPGLRGAGRGRRPGPRGA